jgi:hypothetical protein
MQHAKGSIAQLDLIIMCQSNISGGYLVSVKFMDGDGCFSCRFHHVVSSNMVAISVSIHYLSNRVWATSKLSQQWEYVVTGRVLKARIDQSDVDGTKDYRYSEKPAWTSRLLDEVKILRDFLKIYHILFHPDAGLVHVDADKL